MNYWITQIIFADAMKRSFLNWHFDEHVSGEHRQNINYSSVAMLPNGYPTRVPILNVTNSTGHELPPLVPFVMTYLHNDNTHYYGNYTIILEGSGTVFIAYGGLGDHDTYISPGRYIHFVEDPRLEPSDEGFFIRITESNVSDPITSIKIIIPNHNENDVFNKEFINLFKNSFYSIRPMYLQQIALEFTNKDEENSGIKDWEDRTKVDYRTQTALTGIAYEYLVNLTNLIEANLWFSVPHQATNECIREIAKFLFNNLDPKLKIILEYSNEVWNTDYWQNYWCKYNFSKDASDYHECYANRSIEIFRIFSEEFGVENRHRLIRLFCGQSAVSSHLSTIINLFKTNEYVIKNNMTFDGICITAYFGGHVGDDQAWPALGNVDVEQILDWVNISIGTSVTNNAGFLEHISLAKQNNISLNLYEGGQHLNTRNHNDNTTLVNLLNSAVISERMGEFFDILYNSLFFGLKMDGVFSVYHNIGQLTKYGSFGLMLNMSDTNSPKWVSTMKYLEIFSTCFGINRKSSEVCGGSGRGSCIAFDECKCSSESYYGKECLFTKIIYSGVEKRIKNISFFLILMVIILF